MDCLLHPSSSYLDCEFVIGVIYEVVEEFIIPEGGGEGRNNSCIPSFDGFRGRSWLRLRLRASQKFIIYLRGGYSSC